MLWIRSKGASAAKRSATQTWASLLLPYPLLCAGAKKGVYFLAILVGKEVRYSLEPLIPISVQGAPLAVMRRKHKEIEDGLSALPDAEDIETAGNHLLRVVQVARQHFAKEEQVLFPMAEQMRGPGRLTDLGEQWAEGRRVSVRVSSACLTGWLAIGFAGLHWMR
jgi:hypothetical protein